MKKPTQSAKQAITPVKKQELVAHASEDEMAALAADAGSGLETVTANDMLIPRLAILQDLSPQLKKTKPEYIEGAEVGNICDIATGDLFPEGVLFLPVLYQRQYLEWAPRSTGKGLIKIHNDPAILETAHAADKGPPVLPNGNLIVDTAQFYGMNMSAGGRKCFIPMTSTQLKRARQWVLLASEERIKAPDGNMVKAPLHYRAYSLTTSIQSNNDGEWHVWRVERGPNMMDLARQQNMSFAALREDVKGFYQALHSGRARADVSDLQGEATPVRGSGDEEAM